MPALSGVVDVFGRSSSPYHSFSASSGRFIVLGSVNDAWGVIKAYGGVVSSVFSVINGFVVEGSADLVLKLRSMGFRVFEDRVVYLVNPVSLPVGDDIKPYLNAGTPSIGAPRAWESGFNGSGVRVAIIDTGIENRHPWLTRVDGSSVVSWEVDATGTGVVDYCGFRMGYHTGGIHGTHVAGIVASQNKANPGVAPGVEIYDIIVFPEMIDGIFIGCFSTFESIVIRGVELALLGPDGRPNTGDEADVLSLSLGFVVPPEVQYAISKGIVEIPLIKVLEEAVRAGKVVVVAAGNMYGLNLVNALCLAEGVICVGASSHMGTVDPSDDILAWFSSKGPGPLGVILPHVVAPGVYIYSSIPTPLVYTGEPASYLSGTSMATPFVSGASAILINYYKSRGVKWDPELVKTVLVQTARDVKPQSVDAFWLLPDWIKEYYRPYVPEPPVITPVDQGGGLINVYSALTAEVELRINNKPIGYIVYKGDRLRFDVIARNLIEKNLTLASTPTLVRLHDIYTFQDYSYTIRVAERLYSISPGDYVGIPVEITRLSPGVYAGYIEFWIVETGNLYRIPLVIVVPLEVSLDKLRFLSEFKLRIGSRDVWDVVTLYVDVSKPLLEPLSISTISAPGAPGMVSVTITTPSGYYTSFTNTVGYILGEAGIYTISSSILFSFAWPINVDYKLVIGAPTLTTSVESVLEKLSVISDKITILESTLNTLKLSLESLRLDLARESQQRKEDITRLNNTLNILDSTLKTLQDNLASTRRDLETLSVSLGRVNETLTQRISEEASRIRKLEEESVLLNGQIAFLREQIGALRDDLTRTSIKLSSDISSLSEAHSKTRLGTLAAIIIGLVGLGIATYTIIVLRRK
ncbi:MAG: S8 family serine peptidase [Acidilobaceae archaeon]